MAATHICLLAMLLAVLCIWQVEACRQLRGCTPVKASKCRKQIAHCAACNGCDGKATSCKRCASGWGNCDASSPDCETNLNTTAEHCGACNRPCSPGQTCEAGVCVGPVVVDGGDPQLPEGGSLAVTDFYNISTCEVEEQHIQAPGACEDTIDGYTLTIANGTLHGMLDNPQNPPRCVVVSTCDQQGSTAWDLPDAQLTMEWKGMCAVPGDCDLPTEFGTGTRMLVEYRGGDEVVTFGNAAGGSVCGKPLRVTITASFDCSMLSF